MISEYLGQWSRAQRDQFELCEAIDLVALRLPIHEVDTLSVLAGRLETAVADIYSFEEEDLFPILEAMSPQIRMLLVTFRSHHDKNREVANSICISLRAASSVDAVQLAQLKSELSLFAEMLRRHVQFEEAIAMALFASKRVNAKRAVQ